MASGYASILFASNTAAQAAVPEPSSTQAVPVPHAGWHVVSFVWQRLESAMQTVPPVPYALRHGVFLSTATSSNVHESEAPVADVASFTRERAAPLSPPGWIDW